MHYNSPGMDLDRLYGGSFIDWGAVAASWNKRTVPSRLLLFAARRYIAEHPAQEADAARSETLGPVSLPEEIKRAYAAPPATEGEAARLWGEFVDAAFAAEMEMVSYGERPPLLHELRNGLTQAAEEAGRGTGRGRWFLRRRDALPGTDLPDSPEYLPI